MEWETDGVCAVQADTHKEENDDRIVNETSRVELSRVEVTGDERG